MQRTFARLMVLSCVLGAAAFAQGLNTQASKDDWEEINFEFNSAVLSDGYPSLLCLADQLHKNAGYRVKVEGNTDNIGSERVNEKLGLARANTVRDFLVKYGASPSQIEVTTRGKKDPKYPGFKPGYSKTDVARWMNRRVVVTVTDQSGKLVAAGCGVSPAPPAPPTPTGPNCCDDILARLDKITKLLEDLKGENADLKSRVAKLEGETQAIDTTVNNLPKPLSSAETSNIVDARLDKFRDPRFSLLGLNVGADDLGHVTFTGSGRFFAPFKDHFAIQMQGEYLYYKTQKEAQLDFGLVNRLGNFQGGLFGSFKNVSLSGYGDNGRTGNGTIGQASAVFDWIFGFGKVGVYGTKGFLNNAELSNQNATFTDANGNTVLAPNIFVQQYLHVVDQAGVQGTVGLWGNNYLEANVGYLKSEAHADRPGGTLRFVFPLNNHIALTVEGGLNETFLSAGNSGRAVVGVEFGNLLRPKDFATDDRPEPMQVPRVRYEVITKTTHRGTSPPVADAGPNQIGIPAGTVTLNGSGSYDPNGETLTYQWVQSGGPAVAITNANQAIATFSASSAQGYTFKLTVRNTDGQQASAYTYVSTTKPSSVSILFFIANPTTINAGQSSTLTYKVTNATSVTISPNIGSVNASNGSIPVSPTTTTTYTLTATNSSGGTQTATATVTVNQPKPSLTVCTAVPMSIVQGESTTLYYQTLNATSVTIVPAVGTTIGTSGSVVVSPTSSTTYTLTANNSYGSATCSVGVTVTAGNKPRIVKFSGSPLTIAQDSSSTLLWVTEGAKTVTIDQGVGQVDVAGTANVTPAATTTYTLTATNSFGSTTAQVTITVTTAVVTPPPTITSFTGNPNPSPQPGAPVVLSCIAQNAKTVVISGVGPVDTNGNLTVNPQVTTTYVCVATSSNPSIPSASANLTITVNAIGTSPSGTGSCVVTFDLTGATTPMTTCQTIYRTDNLNLSQALADPNQPLAFNVTSENVQAAVLTPNPTTGTASVQLSTTFGDYFFDVAATDSMGKVLRARVDLQFEKTSIR